jgi:phosphohistidine phosphatase
MVSRPPQPAERDDDTAGVRLYLIRHAIAADRGDEYPDDAKRPLTAKGIARFREVVVGLVSLGVEVDEILTSPATRTRQTAELLAEGFVQRPHISNMHALAVSGQAQEVVDGLARYAKRRRLALVGHEPLIGEVAARLLGSRRALTFRKGAVCAIDVPSLPVLAPGTLLWFLPPRVIRALRDASA